MYRFFAISFIRKSKVSMETHRCPCPKPEARRLPRTDVPHNKPEAIIQISAIIDKQLI